MLRISHVQSRSPILMSSVLAPTPSPQPTNAVPLARLFAYTQSLGLEPQLACTKRGVPSPARALVWLALAWRGSRSPHQLGWLTAPLLAAMLGLARLPTPQTLHR